MLHLLLVEDTVDLWETIRDYLITCWFYVDRTTTISQTKQSLEHKVFDCIILDRMLPDWSWQELCKFIKENRNTPVIMSTAKSQIEDKLEGFDWWADDYITKPYDLRELEVRVIALTKRQENIVATQKFGNLSINTESMIIIKNKKEIHCTASEWIIIKILCESEGRAVSRSDLIDYVRGGEWTWWYENKLDVLISGLRKKLGKNFIETVKWFWYKINSSF